MKSTTMAGTEGTHEYDSTAVQTKLGKIGYRNLGPAARIRIEPKNSRAAAKLASSFTRDVGWKQPSDGGQFRFSIVVAIHRLPEVLKTALLAVAAGDTELSDDTPSWARDIVTAAFPETKTPNSVQSITTAVQPAPDKSTLVSHARKLGVKGANSRWSVETLTAKIAAATTSSPT